MGKDIDPIQSHVGKVGDPMFEACIDAMERMREAVADIVMAQDDPRDGLSIIMTAGAMFAGVQAGSLMSMGEFRSQDKRRLGEAALHNFRQGLDMGLRRGLRIGTDVVGGNA